MKQNIESKQQRPHGARMTSKLARHYIFLEELVDDLESGTLHIQDLEQSSVDRLRAALTKGIPHEQNTDHL